MFLLFMSLAIYAITWQQILKKVPLSIAYVNKATTIVWGLLISSFLFKENISLTNIVGAIVVIIGIIVIVRGEYSDE